MRKNPGRSVLIAAAGGYVCNRLPFASLLAVGAKLAWACAPPTLIALGVCRAAEYCRAKDRRIADLGATAEVDDMNRMRVTDA